MLNVDARTTESRLLAALAAAGTGVWTWDIATDRITWTSECYAIFGLQNDGRPLTLATFADLIHAGDVQDTQEQIRLALATRQPLASEFRIVRPDGQVRWIVNHGRADYDADGTPTGMAGTARDITEQKHIELRWRESQERLSLAVEASGLGLWTWDVATGHVTWTSQCYAIHGLEEGAFTPTADNFFQLVHPADRERVERTVRSAIAANQLYTCEFRIVRPDGQIVWVANRGRARYDANGIPVSVLGTLSDVSDQKRTEVVLNAALEASKTGTFRWDARSESLEGDAQLDLLFGTPADEPITSLQRFLDRLHHDDRSRVLAAFDDCRSNGRDFDQEFRVVCPAGNERWLYGRAVTYRDHQGRPAWITGACVDISALKATERQLRITQDRFQVALEAASDIFWTNDASGRMCGEQPSWAAYTGQTYGQYQGYGWTQALHPDDVEPTLSAWTAAVATGAKFSVEHRVRMRDGQYRTYAVRALPMLDERGKVLEWVGVHTDVTEIREAQRTIERQNEELRRADASKDVFLATLSHELRNPMAPIRAAADLLGHPQVPEERLHWAGGVIRRQVAHVSHLLDDLLDIARITQGKITLRKRLVAIDEVVASALEAVRPLAESRGHRVVVDLTTPAAVVHGDPARLSQVLGNLLTNACKYTDAGGLIELKALVDDTSVRIEVRDNGIGLDSAAIPHLFEMFQQKAGEERTAGGLGVGLALVRGLVELHGGRVEAHSDGPGHGSRFVVSLPAPRTQEPEQPPPPAGPPVLPDLWRVLVVDDNEDAGQTLGEVLRLAGHVVRVCASGREAVTCASEFHPHIALIDLGMPGMDGYALAGALRAEPRTSGVHLVALTGWAQPEDRQRTQHAGFAAHLVKPVDPAEVLQLIARLMPTHRA